MVILDLQRQGHVAGRICWGRRGADGAPEKLDVFRFTSPDEPRLRAVAALYGGDVSEWTHPTRRTREFELVSASRCIAVTVIPSDRTLESWWTRYEDGEQVSQCNGVDNILTGRTCQCPCDLGERAALAEQDRACRPTTTLRVRLTDVPGIGVWRAVSQGYGAAASMPADLDALKAMAANVGHVPATLSLERHEVEIDGETHVYYVPVIDTALTPGQMAAAAAPAPQPADRETRSVPAGRRGHTSSYYRAQAAGARSAAHLAALLAEARRAGLAREGGALAEFFRAQARRLAQPAPAAALASVPAALPDTATLWTQILIVAAERDWGLARVRDEFASRNQGLHPASADAAQFAEFLDWLGDREQVAA